MTATITWDGLRELAAFRAQHGCAISLYLDLDPSTAPTAADAAARVKSLLDEGSKSHGATRSELSHELRQGIRADLDRLQRFFEHEFDRDGAQGLAVFADGPDNFWAVLSLASPVPDAIRVADDFFLAPLVPLVGRGDGALVAVVDRGRGTLYRMRGGRLVELADVSEDAPRRHDQGGWSQARFQRHVDNVAQEHFKAVAEELDARFRRLDRPRIVVFCPEETRPELEEELSHEVADAVVGWSNVEPHAGPAELYAAAAPLFEAWRAHDEASALERWREEHGRGGRAAAGWTDTLEAASDGRVELLLYRDGISRDAFRCPRCGRASIDPGACPLDGTTLEPRDDALDLAVRQTLAHGGTVWAVRHRADLDPADGIAALLRY